MIKCFVACCNYANTPGTYYYVVKALRKLLGADKVMTVGYDNDISAGNNNPYPLLCEKIARGEVALDAGAFLLEVESGGFELHWTPPKELPLKRFWWGIDSHLSLQHHIDKSAAYDHVFLAQNAYVKYVAMRNPNTTWLPLACDEDIHDGLKFATTPPTPGDCTFVGHMFPQVHGRRIQLVRMLTSAGIKVDNYVDVWLELVTALYRRSRVVLNCSLNGDINMRFFEALASGTVLVNDTFPKDSGIDELLDGNSVCTWYTTPEDAIYHIRRGPNEALATAGREWVLGNHTYVHRMKKVMEVL